EPAQVAAASGTTAGTVRSQEQRALEKLRERLDRRFKGERALWAAALARATRPAAAAPTGGEASGANSGTSGAHAAKLPAALAIVVAPAAVALGLVDSNASTSELAAREPSSSSRSSEKAAGHARRSAPPAADASAPAREAVANSSEDARSLATLGG